VCPAASLWEKIFPSSFLKVSCPPRRVGKDKGGDGGAATSAELGSMATTDLTSIQSSFLLEKSLHHDVAPGLSCSLPLATYKSAILRERGASRATFEPLSPRFPKPLGARSSVSCECYRRKNSELRASWSRSSTSSGSKCFVTLSRR